MNKSKLNADGSFTVWPDDGYDFAKLQIKHFTDAKNIKDFLSTPFFNKITRANNRANVQQQRGQLENYILSAPVTYTKEEVADILSQYAQSPSHQQQAQNNQLLLQLLRVLGNRFRK